MYRVQSPRMVHTTSAPETRLAPGSYLVRCDGTDTSAAYLAAVEHYRSSGGEPYNARSAEQIAEFYAGLDVVEPGIGPIQRWRVSDDAPDLAEVGGIGRKP
jgi:hypothetical protein